MTGSMVRLIIGLILMQCLMPQANGSCNKKDIPCQLRALQDKFEVMERKLDQDETNYNSTLEKVASNPAFIDAKGANINKFVVDQPDDGKDALILNMKKEIDANKAKIDAIDAKADSNQAEIVAKGIKINANAGQINAIKANTATNARNINANKAKTATNARNINAKTATNARNINANKANTATNARNINANKANTATNARNINANKANTATNARNINANKAKTATNARNINANKAKTATNARNINANKANTASNARNINANKANTASNARNINANKANTASNARNINANKANTATNARNVVKNRANIDSDRSKVKSLQEEVKKSQRKVHFAVGRPEKDRLSLKYNILKSERNQKKYSQWITFTTNNATNAGMNLKTGRFVAPICGNYAFDFHIRSANGYYYQLYIKVWVNNKVVRDFYSYTNSNSRNWYSSWMLRLKKEDTVGIQLLTPSSSISRTSFYFSGSLIKTDPTCRNECKSGYYGYPNCKKCKCNANGTVGNTCDRKTGECTCGRLYIGHNCQTHCSNCKDSNTRSCTASTSSSWKCNCHSGSHNTCWRH